MRRGAALCLLLAIATGQEDFARVKTLVTQLGSIDEEMRAGAASELGLMGPRAKGAVPALAKALGDDSSWVADRALEAIKRIGPDAVPALVKALGSPDDAVRAGAMRILVESFARDLKPHLRAVALLLRDENSAAREHAATALGQPGEAAIDLLIGAFAARESHAREAAVLGLGKIGGSAVEPLAKALLSGNAQVRAGAARAPGQARRGQTATPAAQAGRPGGSNPPRKRVAWGLFRKGGLTKIAGRRAPCDGR